MRKYGERQIVAVINFSGADFAYRIGVEKGEYKVVFNSDKTVYGGNGKNKKRVYKSERKEWGGKPDSIEIEMPKLSFIYLLKTK